MLLAPEAPSLHDAAQTAAMRLARAVLAQEIAEAIDGPGTALEKLHAVARICEREAQ